MEQPYPQSRIGPVMLPGCSVYKTQEVFSRCNSKKVKATVKCNVFKVRNQGHFKGVVFHSKDQKGWAMKEEPEMDRS